MTVMESSAFVIVFGLALAVSLLLTPIASAVSERYNIIVDKPRNRRKHAAPISKLGGLAIFGGFMIAAFAAQLLDVPRFDPKEVIRFAGLMVGGVYIFVVGLLDDWFELGPVQLYIAQIIAAAIAVLFQIFIESVSNPITGQQIDGWSYVVTVTLSLFWIGLMMNTVNFLDGLDGLAGGVALIAGLMLFVHSAFILRQTSVSLLMLALMGASLGFLLYNFNPARIFMGSNGAYFLGYALGTLSIIGGAKMATILLVMGLPLMDVAWQVVNRLRQGRNPLHGDRGHIHYRLLDAGIMNQRQIVLVYYCFCAFFGILALVIDEQLFKLLALAVMFLLISLGFALLTRLNKVSQIESSVSS